MATKEEIMRELAAHFTEKGEYFSADIAHPNTVFLTIDGTFDWDDLVYIANKVSEVINVQDS
ncbi:MAG: hypothetical protein PHD09_06710 [Candidatus Omnitrophica bacterium]|nr:hypothetical protein [Candidatus Omnitrophota bacterium]